MELGGFNVGRLVKVQGLEWCRRCFAALGEVARRDRSWCLKYWSRRLGDVLALRALWASDRRRNQLEKVVVVTGF